NLFWMLSLSLAPPTNFFLHCETASRLALKFQLWRL
ncbi:MAG: hypothetical protein K0S81_3887, partial [Rhodospirillales bacterium]|nr:hypothetical protein [Rhodospirillales bacterium]